MIKKSLEKNNGKRKLAAKELGISERTLYRKIKAVRFIKHLINRKLRFVYFCNSNEKTHILLHRYFYFYNNYHNWLWSLFFYWW